MSFLSKIFKQKTSVTEFGFEIKHFDLQGYGGVDYAQWLHPFEQPKIIDDATIRFYGQFIKKGDFVMDIGAHTGDTTLPIALCCGKEGLVLAFEPNRYVFKILEANSRLNPLLTNIHAVNYAATAEDGHFVFNYSDPSFCNGGFFDKINNREHGHYYDLSVQGMNTEKYLKEKYFEHLNKLTLVKIDAEGYDKEIIKSLRVILKKYQPYIITECNENLNDGERFELFEILRSLNYSLRQIDNFDNSTVKEINRKEEMLLTKHFDIIAIPGMKKLPV